jgi:hypothetical protein
MSNVLLVKDGIIVRHFYSETEMQAAGFVQADKIVTEEEFNSNGCYARIIGGNIVVGRTEEEISAEEAATELAELKSEVESRDYRALKAYKLGQALDTLYPGETEWYQGTLNRIHELEETLGIA